MSLVAIDVEASGPCPGEYSLLSIGAVMVRDGLKDHFYAELEPTAPGVVNEAMAVNNLNYLYMKKLSPKFHPSEVMGRFGDWLRDYSHKRPIMLSDNPAYDFQFINYYFWKYCDGNPLGWSARRIGDIYAGLNGDLFSAGDFRQLMITEHTHNALDDAMGVAEAMLAMNEHFGLGIEFQ